MIGGGRLGGRLGGSAGRVEGGGGRDTASLRGVVAGFSNGAAGAPEGFGVAGFATMSEAFLTGTGLAASRFAAFVGVGAGGAAASPPLPFASSRSTCTLVSTAETLLHPQCLYFSLSLYTSGASLNLESSSSILWAARTVCFKPSSRSTRDSESSDSW